MLMGLKRIIVGSEMLEMCSWYEGYSLYMRSYLKKVECLKDLEMMIKKKGVRWCKSEEGKVNRKGG